MDSTVQNNNPFAVKAYRQLYLAQVISLMGTGLASVALALLAWELAGDQAGAVLGTALALKMVAYVFIAPVVGGLAHRLPRKNLLIVLDLCRAGLILCLPLVTEIWQIYLLIVLINACAAGFSPLFQATIPDLFNNDQAYTKALSYARLAYDLENLLSPTIAAILLASISFHQLFYLDSLTFVLSAGLIVLASIPAAAVSDRSNAVWDNIRFGISAYLRTPRLRALWALYFAVAAAGGMVIVNSVVYIQGHLGLGQQSLAILLMASGAGSMAIAFAMPSLREHYADRSIVLVGGLLLVMAMGLGIFMPNLYPLMAIWLIIGMGSSLIQTPAGNLIRRSCLPGDSAAYFAANFSLSHAGWFCGYLLAGWLGSQYDLQTAFMGLAFVSLVALLLAWLQFPVEDPEELWHTHEAVEHTHPHVHDQHHSHTHSHDHKHEHQHGHKHQHQPLRHKHPFVIDQHHTQWPDQKG